MTANASRPLMMMVARRARAYFMPGDSGNALPGYDPSRLGAPPPGWIDLGWIENLKRVASTQIQSLRGGTSGAVVKQVASGLDARVEFNFMEWGKLQLALTCRGTHQNVLDAVRGVTVAGVPVLETSTATELFMSTPSRFAPGDLVAVDVDYTGQTGPVGSGMPTAWVNNPSDVQNDLDYARRVTLNLARVSNVTGESIVLQQALLSGVAPFASRAQKVVAFVDHDGGSYFPEWSALFVVENPAGGSLSFYYPRLQVTAPAEEGSFEIAASLEALMLRASFRALPVMDAVDGQQTLCYRAYTPVAGAAVY